MGVGKSTFTFSTSSITIDGGSTTINITRDNQSYSHKLLHGYGDIATLAVGTTSYTWKPTASQLTKFFEEVPAQKSRLIDVYLDTYNGSTKVGRDAHALTVALSEATGKPTVSGFTISDSNTTANGMGVIIDGKSSLTASATPTGKYGATISRNIFTCTYNSKTYESYYINDLIASLPLTTTPTSFTFGYKSTDSRGFSNTATLSKTVAKYQAPHIDTFEVVRCDASGNEDENGTKAKVVIKGSWAAMKVGTAYKNSATLKVGYKTKAATSYTYQTISVSAGTVDVSQLLSATLTAGTDYEFSVQLTDSFTSDTKTGVGCSNVANILYVSADGKEMVIGSDNGNNVAIDSDSLDIRDGSAVLASFTKDSIELGKNSTDSIIKLCGDQGTIRYEKEDGANGRLSITSGNYVNIDSRVKGDSYTTSAQGAFNAYPDGTSGSISIATTTYSSTDQTEMPHQSYIDLSSSPTSSSTMILTDSLILQSDAIYKGLENDKCIIYGAKLLYDDKSQPTSVPVAISLSTANFDKYEYLEFFGTTSEWTRTSCKVYKPQSGSYGGMLISLTAFNGGDKVAYLKCSRFKLTKTNNSGGWQITPNDYNEIRGQSTDVGNGIGVTITRIVGYR